MPSDLPPGGPSPPGDAGVVVAEAELRTVLGRFATGVTVVTGAGAGGPAGLTCQSFASLSLDPPLVCFATSRRSTSWPLIAATGICTVNVLAESQEALARVFAQPATDKFAGVGWSPGPIGAPHLHEALAWIDCRLERVLDGGDHHLVVARVAALDEGGGEPLVFYRGGFGAFRA